MDDRITEHREHATGAMVDKPAITQRTQKRLEEIAELETELQRCYQTIENLTATIAFLRSRK